MQRPPPRFVPLLVVNEQKGSEGHNDARQAESQDLADVVARHTGAGLVGWQLCFSHFGFEAGHGCFPAECSGG